MKRVLLFIASTFLFAGVDAIAQNDVYLVPNPNAARWSYVETDSEGKHIATIYNSIEAIEGNGVNGSMKLRIEEVPVASPKDTVKSVLFYRFNDGEIMVDFTASFIDEMLGDSVDQIIKENGYDISKEDRKEVLEEVKAQLFDIDGEIRGIPRYPEVGKLPDYEVKIKFSIMSMKVMGKERRIVGTEKIQTEAGSFDCFVMEETLTTKAMMMKEVEKNKSWYAYGIGLVKQITYDKKGNLISTMILNEIN